MKRSFLGALLVMGSAALTLSGCGGDTFEQIEKAPPTFQRDSAKSRAQVAACLSYNLSRFGSDLGNFPDIDFGVTRLTLGGDDGSHYQNYYRIDIIEEGRGSRVTVRRSKVQDNALRVGELADIVAHCAD
ncbi:hypothetical protein OVY01_00955 [Robbsia sp. Bb-Pol-6]|uniref:Lipoprotein n=1 Tax=Robbsia betulipollinis TaxID=2981849 RepID=A0ABT3ZH25_9BURK|nr:hypothetical protein [Robbsia betulipollinis]MCY0385831.1 hypothetical protein [Robbsia betulipollinis]